MINLNINLELNLLVSKDTAREKYEGNPSTHERKKKVYIYIYI